MIWLILGVIFVLAQFVVWAIFRGASDAELGMEQRRSDDIREWSEAPR